MATEVVMPKLGLTMERGTIGAWLAEEGAEVQKGEPLLEVVTDKVTMEVESQVTGVLRKILVPEGVEVDVSLPIGIIAAADEDISELLAETSPAPAEGQVASGQESDASPSAPSREVAPDPGPAPASVAQPPASAPGDGRHPHKASPKARKMAAAQGIDLNQVVGSGPGGRIVSADLETFVAQQPAASAPRVAVSPASPDAGQGALVELTRPQQVAAERLTESSRDIPHIHIFMDVSAVWLEQFRQGYRIEGKKISINDLIVKATAKALGEFPRVNSVLEGNMVRQLEEVSIGFAVDSPQGLLVPVVRQVAARSIEEIAAETTRLIEAVRSGSFNPDDLSGGTFTISNLGMYGVSHFTAIINPPQVAILAVGAIEKRVVAMDNDAMAVRPQLTLDLAADHRVIDGALAARFLARLKEILETPGLLG
jgi:pyruvate dehydrogenase E2 component (dihydrolipoamide acetyltransferase)